MNDSTQYKLLWESLNEELVDAKALFVQATVRADNDDGDESAAYWQKGYMDGLTFALKLFAKFNWERELKDDT